MATNFNELFDKAFSYYEDGNKLASFSPQEKQEVLGSIEVIISKQDVEEYDLDLFEQLYIILWYYDQADVICQADIRSKEIEKLYLDIKQDFENV